MSKTPNEIHVYRYGDEIALSILLPNGISQTVYLRSLMTERLSAALNAVLKDIETIPQFSKSQISTIIVK